MHKRGSELTAAATVTQADLRTAVFFLDKSSRSRPGTGQLTLRGTASFLGLTATVDATVAAQNGALVVAPDVPFGGIATLTLFNDPHVQVQSVGATNAPGGFRVSAPTSRGELAVGGDRGHARHVPGREHPCSAPRLPV